ncbi:MAG: hypothetical protein ACLFVL_05225 [Candidatus Aenigmatarchaeota archaeon]
MTICILTSITIYDTFGWWFPAATGIAALVGSFSGKDPLIDAGILLSASSFFYFIRYISLSFFNLFFVLAMFFLYFGTWSFMKRARLIEYIEKDLVGEGEMNLIDEYKAHSALYSLWSLLLSFVVASAGSLIAVSSFVGPFSEEMSIFLLLLISSIVLSSVYVVVVLLPKYFTMKS